MTAFSPNGAATRPRPSPLTGLVPSRVGHGLSAALAVVALAAAIPTFVLDDVLHGPPVMVGSARGTALVMALVGVPLLVGSQLDVRRGRSRSLPLWLAGLGYLLYNAFMLLFATPFNALFLLYLTTFALALWGLIAVLSAIDVPAFADRVSPGVPRRSIAVFCWVVAVLNTLAWLARVVPAGFEGVEPAFLAGTGLATGPGQIQDLAFWLPLMAVAGFWLWRGLALGYLVTTAVLAMWVAESITIAADQFLGSAADPGSPVASAAMVPVFAVVALVTLLPTLLLLRRM